MKQTLQQLVNLFHKAFVGRICRLNFLWRTISTQTGFGGMGFDIDAACTQVNNVKSGDLEIW